MHAQAHGEEFGDVVDLVLAHEEAHELAPEPGIDGLPDELVPGVPAEPEGDVDQEQPDTQ